MKIFLLLITLTLVLHGTPLGAAESKSKDVLKLRVGLGSSPVPPLPNSVIWLAKDLGFYQREGLDIELIEFQGTPLAIAAMISGDIDVANISTSEVIRMRLAVRIEIANAARDASIVAKNVKDFAVGAQLEVSRLQRDRNHSVE